VDAFEDASQITKFLNETSAQPFADMYRSGLTRTLAILSGLEDRMTSLSTSLAGIETSTKLGVAHSGSVLTTPNSDASSYDSQNAWAVWTSVYGRDGYDKEGADAGSKAKYAEGGVQFGVEHGIGSLTIGLLGSTGWGRTNQDSPNSKITTDSWNIGLYGILPLNSLVLDASFLYGTASNDSVRNPNVANVMGANPSYHSTFDSSNLSLSLGMAYNMTKPENPFQAAPVLRLAYLNYTQNAFNEHDTTGAGNAWAYQVGKMDASTFISKLGYRVAYNTKISSSTAFGADLAAYWQHDWDNKGRGVDAALQGGQAGVSYRAIGRKGTADATLLNGGLQLNFNDRYLLRGSAVVELSGERENLTGMATIGVRF
jgi:hypothetical protein